MSTHEAQTPRFSVVIPTLNEGDSIDPLFERLFRALDSRSDFEVLVVDDASRDETVAKARAWAADHPVRVIERSGPPDLSGAVLDGAREALGQWVVVMDADGSHPPERIEALVEPLLSGQSDLTIGSRHAPAGATRGWPWHRHLASGLATALAWPFTEVRDPMAGFFATSRARLLALPEHTAGYKILLELLVQGGDAIRSEEVPIVFEDRQQGQSKLGLKQQLTYLKRLTYLAGGRVSAGSAGKFILVGLSGMLVDLLIFQLLIGQQVRLGSAHMASFVVATLTNFALNYRWTFSGQIQADVSIAQRYLRFLIVAVMALMIRGGVLVLLVETLGMTPMAAVIPAIIITAGVNYLGSAFYVFASTASGVVPRVRWHLAILGLLAYVIALRLLYMGQIALIPDEMYYWVYAQRLDLSYLDHPPLIAWLIATGTALFGDSIFGLRAPLIPLTLAGAVAFYFYGATMRDRTTGLMCVLVFTVVPFFSLSGLLMTPDAPMLVAWAAALYFFKRALIDDHAPAFVGLGLAMGIGLLAKYTMALLAPAGLLYMLIDRRTWHWFARPEPYLAVLLACLINTPMLVWNAQNSWASLLFQSTRRLFENPEFASHMVLVYAVVLLSPVVALAGFLALGPAARRLEADSRKRRFMLVMTGLPLLIFAVYGLFTVVKFHWTLPAWIALLPMVSALLSPGEQTGQRKRSTRLERLIAAGWVPSIVTLVLAYGLLLHALTLGLPGLRISDSGSGYLTWEQATEEVKALERSVFEKTGRQPVIASTSKWSGAAALAWHYRPESFEHITGQNLIGMRGSMWEYWFDPATPGDRPVILINRSGKLINEAWLEQALIDLGPLERIELVNTRGQTGALYYRIGQGFKPSQIRTARQPSE